MPILQNRQHEAFAEARAKGAGLQDAFEDAGFAPDRADACRLAKRDDVAARVAGLRQARDSEALKTAAGLKEARLNLLEANRLRVELTNSRNDERFQISRECRA